MLVQVQVQVLVLVVLEVPAVGGEMGLLLSFLLFFSHWG